MNKNIKKIVSMVAAVAIIAAMGLGAFSYFTDYATQSVDAVAGTFDIALDQTIDLTEGLNIMNPGDANPFEFTVTNMAQKAADVYAVVTVTGTPADSVTSTKNPSPYHLLVDGTKHEFVVGTAEVKEVKKDANTYVYTLPVNVLSGEKEADAGDVKAVTYQYEIGMDINALNEWEGSEVDVMIEVYAKQHRNTTTIAQADWTKVAINEISATDVVDVQVSK